MLFAPLSAYITDFNVLSTLEVALSGSRQLRTQLEIALSSIPIHPYEKLKKQYLTQEFTPASIEELPLDPNFCPNTCLANICAISIKMNDSVMSHFYSVTSESLTAMECNAFIELSSTSRGEQFVINPSRSAGYLGMLELIKNIPISLIEREPEQTAKKLISHYIKVMS